MAPVPSESSWSLVCTQFGDAPGASPLGQGCKGYLPRGFLLLPLPRSGLVGLASPGGFGSGRSAPGAPLPGRWGGPSLCLCLFPPFLCFCFVPSSGSARVSRVVELPWPLWLKFGNEFAHEASKQQRRCSRKNPRKLPALRRLSIKIESVVAERSSAAPH